MFSISVHPLLMDTCIDRINNCFVFSERSEARYILGQKGSNGSGMVLVLGSREGVMLGDERIKP